MQTWMYMCREFDTDLQKSKARHNRLRNFEIMAISFYQLQKQKCKIESFFASGKQKKNWLF